MRKSWLIVGALSSVIANPLPAEKQQNPPSGIGTGVTIAIAPPGGSPSGCVTDYKGHFAIAAINVTSYKQFDVQGGKGDLKDGGMDNMAGMEASPVGKGKAAKAAAPTPKVTGVARLLNVNKAAQEEDITITVRSTRTHTRTVTVQSNLGKGKPAVAVPKPTPAPAPVPVAEAPSSFKAGGKVKAAVLYQIGDGQVQAPVKPVAIPLPAPQTSNSAFAPIASDAPKISQIGDGQIQAPTGTPKAAKAGSGAAPKGPSGGSSPKGPAAAGPDLSGPPPAGGSMAGMSGHGGHMKRAANKPSYCAGGKPVKLTLTGGILKDQDGRTGYIADNRQFQ